MKSMEYALHYVHQSADAFSFKLLVRIAQQKFRWAYGELCLFPYIYASVILVISTAETITSQEFE